MRTLAKSMEYNASRAADWRLGTMENIVAKSQEFLRSTGPNSFSLFIGLGVRSEGSKDYTVVTSDPTYLDDETTICSVYRRTLEQGGSLTDSDPSTDIRLLSISMMSQPDPDNDMVLRSYFVDGSHSAVFVSNEGTPGEVISSDRLPSQVHCETVDRVGVASLEGLRELLARTDQELEDADDIYEGQWAAMIMAALIGEDESLEAITN